jgi:hypothetical protein
MVRAMMVDYIRSLGFQIVPGLLGVLFIHRSAPFRRCSGPARGIIVDGQAKDGRSRQMGSGLWPLCELKGQMYED